jgi:nitroreductase
MNETINTIISRRSIKAYTDELVSDYLLNEITTAATYSASGMNKQSALMVVVKDKALRNKLSALNASILGITSDPFYNAPVVIVVLADSNVRTYVEDGSLVMGNLMNAAHSVGVSSCWIHRAKEVFETQEGKELLKEWGIPESYKGIGNCILGYPKDKTDVLPKPRKENYVIYK